VVTFTLSQQIDAGSIAVNSAKTVTFGRAGQSARILYAGTAGQNLALNFTSEQPGRQHHRCAESTNRSAV
jgi:hypothetical protein